LARESGGCGYGRDFIRTKTAQLWLDVAGCLNNTGSTPMPSCGFSILIFFVEEMLPTMMVLLSFAFAAVMFSSFDL